MPHTRTPNIDAQPSDPEPSITELSDTEMLDFEQALLRSVDQMHSGVFARTHTPADIAAYKARGRPVGSTKPNAKLATKIRFDPDVLAALKATGKGWQTRVNETMRAQFASAQSLNH